MHLWFALSAGVLGAIVGSFLNVVILRLKTGMTLGGRSKCFSCARQLPWFELVPLLSYLFLRGRCRACGSRISLQYPLVEALTAVVFGLAAWGAFIGLVPFSISATSAFLLALVFWSLLIAIAAYDLRHKIIPDILVYLLGSAAFLFLVLETLVARFDPQAFLFGVIAGACVSAFFVGLFVLTKGRGVGLGDAKLALAIGLFVGFPAAADVLIFSFWLGALVSLALLLSARAPFLRAVGLGTISMKTEMPFAPFLVLAAALVSFFGVSVVSFF